QVPITLHVIDALGASFERVAKACQIEPGDLRGHSLFSVAYERCGVQPESVVHVRPHSSSSAQSPAAQQAPGNPPDVDPPPTAGKQARPGGNNRLQKVDTGAGTPSTSGSSCLSRCAQSHKSCTSKCGDEPKQGSQYDAYQACLGGCLKSASQCKLGCN